MTWLCFYQTRSPWSRDQGSNRKNSAVHNFAPTVTKFCVMWEGQALPHDTKFSNCRCDIVGRRVIFIWSLIPGLSWSGLIKAEPGDSIWQHRSGPTFAKVMVCFRHQAIIWSRSWLSINEARFHLAEGQFHRKCSRFHSPQSVWKWRIWQDLYISQMS